MKIAWFDRINLNSFERKALIFFLVFSAGFSILPVKQTYYLCRGSKDYGTWEKVAHLVREGRPIFPPGIVSFDHNFFYPPAIATLLYTPVSFGGPVLMVIILCALTCIGHLASILLSVWLATGRIRGVHHALYWMAFLITIPFVWDIYFLGQLNLTLLAVMLLGFTALEQRRPVTAGALLALSAAAKAFPVTAIFYLIWRRQWLAAASMLATLGIVLVLLPAPIRGFDRNLQELQTWAGRMVMSNSSETLANQPDRGYRYGNQCLISVVNRLTRPLPVGKAVDGNMTVNILNVEPVTSFYIFLGVAGTMCLIFILAMPPRRLGTRRSNAIEYSILLILIVVFSPKAGSFYYCWLLPGFTVALGEALQSPAGSLRRLWITGGIALSVAVMIPALTQSFDRRAQGMGATMWGAVVLFGTLVALLWNIKRRPPATAGQS